MLLVDDLVDTGKTAKVVREIVPRAHLATVYAKPMGRPLVDTFITEVSQDTWIYFPWDTGLAFQPPINEAGLIAAGRAALPAGARLVVQESAARTGYGRPPRGRGEMVDARDLKSLGRKAVRVRVPPSAPTKSMAYLKFASGGLIRFGVVATSMATLRGFREVAFLVAGPFPSARACLACSSALLQAISESGDGAVWA